MASWGKLQDRARRVLEQVWAELPPDLAAVARSIPCLLEPENGDDPDLLGMYLGDFRPGQLAEGRGPIALYLRAIEWFCEDEGENFEEQVRLTYLHELGHHFGWDEGDLEERGLE